MAIAGSLRDIKETAERYGVPESWLYEQVACRKRDPDSGVPYYKVGKYLRFDWQELDLLFRR